MIASSLAPRTIADPERAACVVVLRERLLGRPEILVACLHGSFQERLPFRDIDVAVWVDPAGRVEADWIYATDLAVALSAAVGLTVDVQLLNSAPLAFRHHALLGEPLVASDDALLADLRASTWDRYFDFQPFALAYWRDVVDG